MRVLGSRVFVPNEIPVVQSAFCGARHCRNPIALVADSGSSEILGKQSNTEKMTELGNT
jgi:hypothetical protein